MAWLDITLLVLAIIGLLLVNTTAVLMVALQLPGTWLMLLATGLFAWAYWENGDPMIGWWALVILLALAVIGEIVEGLGSAVGAKGAGGSKRGVALAIVLGVIGAILGTLLLSFIPIIGTLIGAALGSGVGSVLGDLWAGREWKLALRSGQGAAVGRFAGSVGKLGVACAMWLVAVVALIWP